MSDATVGDLVITAVAGLVVVLLAAHSLLRPDSSSFTRRFHRYLYRWSVLPARASLILLLAVSLVIMLMGLVPLLKRIL